MPKRILSWTGTWLLVVCFAIAPCDFAASPSQQHAAPAAPAKLFVSETLHDLGEITDHRELDVRFVLRNVGGQRLVINELDSGCACSNARQPTVIIPPEGSAEVAVKLDTRFISGRAETKAAFACNDPATPQFTLIARAYVTTDDLMMSISTDAAVLAPTSR